jgi:uncharacterized protein YbjQ (UPF0145 family)
MITTTTNTIPNTEITEILSIVHNRVVLGANVFSDISASFSDFFGGKNTAYDKRLSEITTEVIEGLTVKASKLKADAIVGLNIDVDEISGGGKQMFMVTAFGTAVKLKKNSELAALISSDDLEVQIQRVKFLKEFETGTINVNDPKVYNFLSDNSVPEVFNRIVDFIFTNKEAADAKSYANLFNSYVSQLNHDVFFEKTFEYMCLNIDDNKSPFLFGFIKSKIIIDYDRIISILENGTFDEKCVVLNFVTLRKKYYSKDDINSLIRIMDLIETTFVPKFEEFKKDSLLQKGKSFWRCLSCGSESNLFESEYCKDCRRDKFGTTFTIPNKITVLSKLEIIKSALNSL